MGAKKPLRPVEEERLGIRRGNALGKARDRLPERGDLREEPDDGIGAVNTLGDLLDGLDAPGHEVKGNGELRMGVLLTLLAHGKSSLGYQYINLATAIILTWMGDRSGDKDFYAMAKECARLALGFDQPGDQTPKP